jgi:hypothetical protein
MKKLLSGKNKLMRVILASMMIAYVFATSVSAATSDPYLVSYIQPYVNNLVLGDDLIELYTVPADISYTQTYFSNYGDAVAVIYSEVTGGGIESAVNIYQDAYDETGNNDFVSFVDYEITNLTEVGAFTVHAENPATGATTDITVSITESSPATSIANPIQVQAWVPSQNVLVYSNLNVSSIDFYENIGYRSYVTALDALVNDQQTASTDIDAYNTRFSSGLGDMVDSITINTVQYDNYDPNYDNGTSSWQYRVYRAAPNSSVYAQVPLSENMGSDSIRIFDGDIVVYAYGDYNNPSQFPTSVTWLS